MLAVAKLPARIKWIVLLSVKKMSLDPVSFENAFIRSSVIAVVGSKDMDPLDILDHQKNKFFFSRRFDLSFSHISSSGT